MQLLSTFNNSEKWCTETFPKVTQILVESGFEPRKPGLKPTCFNYYTEDQWSPPPPGSPQCHLWAATLSGSSEGNSCQAYWPRCWWLLPLDTVLYQGPHSAGAPLGKFLSLEVASSLLLVMVATNEWWFGASTPANIIFRALFVSAAPITISSCLSPC